MKRKRNDNTFEAQPRRKSRVLGFMTLFAVIPFAAAMMSLQSCGGEGGPTTGGTGGLPSATAAFRALWPDAQQNATYIGSAACADSACHGGADGEPIYTHWQATKHADEGVGCERCHGPGSVHGADPEGDNILKYPKMVSSTVCAQCHGSTHQDWLYSKHSKLVVSPIESTILNPATTGKNSRCIACHSGLFRTQIVDAGVDIPTMPDADIRTIARNTIDIVPQTANCSTCHDPHRETGNLSGDGKEVQLRHKTFNTSTTETGPGSTAASFTMFDHICAQCHNGRGTDPSDTRLNSSTSRPSMHDSNQFNMLMGFGGVEGTGPVQRNTAHATAPGQCSKCHTPDSRHTFTVSYDKSCSPCHTAADAATRVNTTKNQILNSLLALRGRMEAWALDTFGNADYWDYTSIITGEGGTPPNQSLVPIQVKRARHNYYFVIRSGDYGAHNAPYANHLITVGNENMDALTAPRPALRAGMSMEAMLRITEADRKRARHADLDEVNER